MNCRCDIVLANSQYKGFHEEERWLSKQAFTVFSCPRSYRTGLVYNLLPEPLGKLKQSWAGVSAVPSNSWVTIGKLLRLHQHFLTCTNEDYNTHLKGWEGGLETGCWVTILMNKQESSLILFSAAHWRSRAELEFSRPLGKIWSNLYHFTGHSWVVKYSAVIFTHRIVPSQ